MQVALFNTFKKAIFVFDFIAYIYSTIFCRSEMFLNLIIISFKTLFRLFQHDFTMQDKFCPIPPKRNPETIT